MWYRKLNGFDDKNNLQCSFERCFCESCKFFNRKMSRILIGYAEVSVFFLFCLNGSILTVRLKVFCDYLLSITEIQVKGTHLLMLKMIK